MNNKILLFLLPLSLCAEPVLVDQGRALVRGPSKHVIITMQDYMAPLDSEPKTLRDLVIEELMLVDAELLHISVPPDELERRLIDIQKRHRKTREELHDFFKTAGLTFDQVVQKLQRQATLEQIFDYRIRQNKRMLVSKEEKEDYYKTHPEKEEASITVVQAFVSSSLTPKEFEENIERYAISWGTPFTLKEHELADDKKFLMTKEAGDLALIEPVENGFEVTKIIEKLPVRIRPFDEEESKRIEAILQKIKFDEIFEAYINYLFSIAEVRFTYESDREAVLHPPKVSNP